MRREFLAPGEWLALSRSDIAAVAAMAQKPVSEIALWLLPERLDSFARNQLADAINRAFGG